MAGDDLIGLSDNDVRILREMAAEHRNRGSGGTVGPYRNPTDYSSPDLYLALPPDGGIPALDPLGTGSSGDSAPQEGDEPGHALCQIYHLSSPSGTGEDVTIKKISGLTRTVYNLTRKIIPRDWTPVQRLKGGNWIAVGNSGGSTNSSGTAIYVALPRESLGVPPLERGTVGTEDLGDDIPGGSDVPGRGICDIYKIVDGAISNVAVSQYVYNIFRVPILREWFVVGQDAFGKWIALHPPLVRRVKVELKQDLNAGWITLCDPAARINYATAWLKHADIYGVWTTTDEEIIIQMPSKFKGVWFAGEEIEVEYLLQPIGWFPVFDGHTQFIGKMRPDGDCLPSFGVTISSRLTFGTTYTDSATTYNLNAYLSTAGGAHYPPISSFTNEPVNVFWDDVLRLWIVQYITQVVMPECAYFVWCDSAWQSWSAGSDPQIYGPSRGQGVFYAPSALQTTLLATLTGSGVTGRFTGETVLICECGSDTTPPTTTTTTSTTTTTTTTPSCCSQMPSTIAFELVDSGDCHYSGQVATLTRSGNTWSWSGTTACGDSLTITLTCNPSGGGTVSALTLSLNYPCAVPSTITGTIPGSCTCADISACEASYTAAGDVSACNCCTTTTTTTTSTTTTTTTTYRCSGNPCGSCVRQWISGSWIVFSSSCTAPCLTSSASCCSPGFAGTVEGQLATVGCCKPPVYSCS